MFGLPVAVWIGAAFIGSSLPVLWWSVAASNPRDDVQSRLRVDNDLRKLVLSQNASERVLAPGIERLAQWARAISPIGMVDRLARKITLAGSGERWPLERVLGAKLILGFGLALIGALRWFADPGDGRTLVMGVFLTVGAFVTPDLLIGIRATKRQEDIALTLPDILDQMTISVEAGLGFDSAIGHVVQQVDSPLSNELARVLQDMQLGMTRTEAFDNLSQRTDVQELRQFVVALQQADKLGVPIANVLRSQSKELRTVRRQRAEEKAQTVPVKMILPLVLLILPALVLIVLAPAAFELMDSFL